MTNETLKIILDWVSLHQFFSFCILLLLGWLSIMLVGIVEVIAKAIGDTVARIFGK